MIVLRQLSKRYAGGDGEVVALDRVDLTIERGEIIAIMGASGSGKSTLLNIIGCLDRASEGEYRIDGQDTSVMTSNELAAVRRDRFGFVFQRYNLLPSLSAAENVELPAIYAGYGRAQRRQRACALLEELGLADRTTHSPNKLSGGQQQRVSIARALINQAEVILADEPTGALDRNSGADVLRILGELHAAGKTVVIVTHDPGVASHAHRIIKLEDGRVVEDITSAAKQRVKKASPVPPVRSTSLPLTRWVQQALEATHMASLAMTAHWLRTTLTMLGISIGIASVVLILSLANVARAKVLADINALGTNTIEIFAGKELGDVRSAKIKTLVASDARALEQFSYIAGVTPTASASAVFRAASVESNGLVNGVGDQYFAVKGAKLLHGVLFDADNVRHIDQVAVIDDAARKALFADDPNGGVGAALLIGNVPVRVVGVMQLQQSGFGASQNPSVYVPYTTLQARITGSSTLRSILIRINDTVTPKDAESDIDRLLMIRHRVKDFAILNSDDIRKTVGAVTATLAIMIAGIAGISLLVGGVGVMNIMLVAVTERTSEIGLRLAVGARRSDILQQFLIEAIAVCSAGGLLGIGVALAGQVLSWFLYPDFGLSISPLMFAGAVGFSTVVGIVFGYVPARRASTLDPLTALTRD